MKAMEIFSHNNNMAANTQSAPNIGNTGQMIALYLFGSIVFWTIFIAVLWALT
jgi:hypothetical protein